MYIDLEAYVVLKMICYLNIALLNHSLALFCGDLAALCCNFLYIF